MNIKIVFSASENVLNWKKKEFSWKKLTRDPRPLSNITHFLSFLRPQKICSYLYRIMCFNIDFLHMFFSVQTLNVMQGLVLANKENLVRERGRLQHHAYQSCFNCMMMLMVVLVVWTFLAMIIVMRVFPKNWLIDNIIVYILFDTQHFWPNLWVFFVVYLFIWKKMNKLRATTFVYCVIMFKNYVQNWCYELFL